MKKLFVDVHENTPVLGLGAECPCGEGCIVYMDWLYEWGCVPKEKLPSPPTTQLRPPTGATKLHPWPKQWITVEVNRFARGKDYTSK